LIFLIGASCFSEEAETTEYEFKVFGVGRDHYEGLYYYTGETFELLEFHRTHRSIRTYQYKGPLAFGIHVKNPDYDATDPQSLPYTKISESSPPTRSKRQLIVFAASSLNRESSDPERKFTLYHIDDSPEAFRRNTIIVINTTRAELFGSVADSEISLPTGHSSPIPYTSGNSASSATNISFALETKSGAKLVMSNDLKLPNNRRVVLILEPPRRPGSLRIAVRMLSESIFLEEENSTLN
jgi:hypothetical protein